MKITTLLLSILVLFSCNNQNASYTAKKLSNALIGKVVPAIVSSPKTIFQDRQNNYWFGGSAEGVYKYDGQQLLLFSTADGLCSTSVLGIQEDQLGNMYFDTQKGVSKFDGQQFTTLPVIPSDTPGNEWQLAPNDLWFRMGWDKNGPCRYDGKSLYQLEFPKTERGAAFHAKYPNASYNPYGIYSMYTDSKGHLWFGTASLGLCRYDGKVVSWLYEKQLTETPNGGDFGIRSIIEDKAGDFWFCSTRHRYEILPESSARDQTNHLNYNKTDGIGFSKTNNEIDYPYFMSIAEDNEGDLWMATYDEGVWRNTGTELLNYPVKAGDTPIALFSIYKDKQGLLWLTSHEDGVYRFNGTSFVAFEP